MEEKFRITQIDEILVPIEKLITLMNDKIYKGQNKYAADAKIKTSRQCLI